MDAVCNRGVDLVSTNNAMDLELSKSPQLLPIPNIRVQLCAKLENPSRLVLVGDLCRSSFHSILCRLIFMFYDKENIYRRQQRPQNRGRKRRTQENLNNRSNSFNQFIKILRFMRR